MSDKNYYKSRFRCVMMELRAFHRYRILVGKKMTSLTFPALCRCAVDDLLMKLEKDYEKRTEKIEQKQNKQSRK